MNKPGFFVSCFLPVLMVAMTACSRRQSLIGVIPRTTATPLWESLHLGVAEAAKGDGFHLYWNAPSDETDPKKQLEMLAVCASRHPRGVIFAPDDTFASRSAIFELASEHVPMVIVDDEPGPQAGPLLSYVMTDEEAGADLAAEQVATILQGRGSIAIIGISAGIESGTPRENSFESALARRAPGVRVVVRRFGDSLVAHQQKVAQEILNGPDHIDAIVALSEPATRGALLAKLASDSQSKIHIIGFDQGSLIPIQAGYVDAVIAQDTRMIGRIAMKNLEAEIRGEKVNGMTKVPPVLLTQETLHSPKVVSLWEFAHHRWSEQ